MADVNPEPRAIDEDMDRLVRGEPVKSNVMELLQSPREGRVVGDREIDLEELCQATEKALGLAKRKMEDGRPCGSSEPPRSRCLRRTVAAGFTVGRTSPGIERVIRKPDGQVATLLKACLVLRPIPHPISRLRVLVLAALRILHRCSLREARASRHHEPTIRSHAPTPLIARFSERTVTEPVGGYGLA